VNSLSNPNSAVTAKDSTVSMPATTPIEARQIRLVPALTEHAPAWDSFVEAHPEGRFSQLWGFRKALSECYGMDCVYLNVFAGDRQCGVFPLVRVKGHPRRLLSLPFIEYGGPLLEGLAPERYCELAESLVRYAREQKCGAVEIRGGIGLDPPKEVAIWLKQPVHSYGTLALSDPDRMWRSSLTNEARKGVNRARKEGLRVEIRKGRAAVGDDFYDLYLLSMKRLGAPPHPRKFFSTLADGIGERLVASWIRRDKQTAAVLIGGVSGQRIHIFTTVSNPDMWNLRPNDMAHWELICWAQRSGLRTFDFGSARYGGQIQFKKKWGADLTEYCQHWIGEIGQAAALQLDAMQSSGKLMRAASYLWRHAMPLALTPILGPAIRKYVTR
jgi:CelD/BcsL family acetyltransferase involved in cellulose biosynthesis